jgi:uncharacterized protein (TIGR03546 family)
MMVLRWVMKMFAALNANTRPGEVAAGFAMGIWLALIPSGNLLWIFLLLITLLIKVHFSVALVAMGIGKLFTGLLDGLLHEAGYSVLTVPSLESFFTSLYNTPFIPFTLFNDSIVMGGFIAGFVLFIPIYILLVLLVKLYRRKIRDRIADTKLVKALKKIPLVSKLGGAYGSAKKVLWAGS